MNSDPSYLLDLACAVHLYYGEYQKKTNIHYDLFEKALVGRYGNRDTMLHHLGKPVKIQHDVSIPSITITDEAKDLSNNIKNFYKRLIFNAITGDLDRETKDILNILHAEKIHPQKIGLIAYMPVKKLYDEKMFKVQKRLNNCIRMIPYSKESKIINKKCEIILITPCTNYPGKNYHGIIDDTILVSWYEESTLDYETIMINSANIKDIDNDWHLSFPSIRLRTVKYDR